MTAIARAYSRLKALVETLEGVAATDVEERYVDEYHSIIEQLATEGFALGEFRVPGSDLLVGSTVAFRYGGGSGRRIWLVRHVARAVLLMKARGLLSYFEITSAAPSREIGFRPPQDE